MSKNGGWDGSLAHWVLVRIFVETQLALAAIWLESNRNALLHPFEFVPFVLGLGVGGL